MLKGDNVMRTNESILLLDIETTGLNREQDQLISIGLMTPQEDPIYLFVHQPEAEKDILLQFLALCERFNMIYTYQGKRFDYPFLLARMAQHHLDPAPFLKCQLIDMKKALTPIGDKRQVLENSLHFTRQSSSTGRDMIKLYRTYLTSQDALYQKLILAHQQDELLSLGHLFSLYNMLYHIKSASCHAVNVTPTQLTLTYDLITTFPYDFAVSFPTFTLTTSKQAQRQLTLNIPYTQAALKHALTPLKDYYFIPSEQKLMHKTLAQFLPKSQRRRATKEECVVYQEGTYLPLVTTYKVNAPIWYEDNQSFILADASDATLWKQQIFYFFFQAHPIDRFLPKDTSKNQ